MKIRKRSAVFRVCVAVFASVASSSAEEMSARINFDDRIGVVGKEMYGGFIEHLGRNVYGGVYDPDDVQSDSDGFRKDVIAELKELDTPIFRYPGGCYTDLWCWEDGVGPRQKRPVRLDPYWKQKEDNSFGLHEFVKWLDKVGAEPMITLNLSNRGVIDAARLWEYCNFPGGTAESDRRRANGDECPFGVKYWCLGNEIYGSWEIGQKDAVTYGQLARETGKVLKLLDPKAVTILCGCGDGKQAWNETVLDLAWKYSDMLSIHQGNKTTSEGYGRVADSFSWIIKRTAETIRKVRKTRPPEEDKEMPICVDEYFFWNFKVEHTNGSEWTKAPPILMDIYTRRDAVVLGDMMTVLHNHSDVVKMACIAQSVNTLAPIRTEKGRTWRQTIFDPLRYNSRYGRGDALRISWSGNADGDVHASAVWNSKKNRLALFVVNRATNIQHRVGVPFSGRWRIVQSKEIAGNPNERNTADCQPVRAEDVSDIKLQGGSLDLVMKPVSWRMVILSSDSMCDVTDYGAKGDGVTDDSGAIQAVLDRTERPLVVRIPAGTYRIGTGLKVHDRTTIVADPAARIFYCGKKRHQEGDFLLSTDGGKTVRNIEIRGGIWDGNAHSGYNVKPRDIFEPRGWSGATLNFRKVQGLVLKNMELANSVTYNIRMCEIDGFDISNIVFTAKRKGWNQDGLHFNGFCINGRVMGIRAVTKGQTNDDLLAFNADDCLKRIENRGMVCGPISNIVCRGIYAEDCHTAVRLLSVDSPISDVRIKDVVTGVRCYAVNGDAARYCRTPLFKESDRAYGVGSIRNVSIDGCTFWRTAGKGPMVTIETNIDSFVMTNVVRNLQRDAAPTSPFMQIRNIKPVCVELDGVHERLGLKEEKTYQYAASSIRIGRDG